MLTKLIQIVVFLCFSISCCLAKVSNIVVFGDSYSDVGNGQLSSNGPLWSQDLAVGWNASLYNFAFSGATCDRSLYHAKNNTSSSSASAPPSIVDQLEMYYKQQLDLAPKDTIYAFWVGHTDIYNMVQANNKDYDALVDCVIQQMRNVRKVFHTDRFLMFTLAPMENMPYFNNGNNKKELFKAAVDTFNEQLHKKVFNLVGHHQSLELDLVDAHDLLKDMINTPSDFGFKDGQHSFWDACQGQCTDSVDDYIWWDKTHLTGGAHRVIANSILISDSLEPSVTLSLPVADLIQGSRFQSPHYQPKYNTGLIDKLVKEWDAAKVDEHSDVTVDKDDAGDSATDSMVDEEDHWIRPLYFGALLTVVLCLGFVFYNKRSKRRAGGSLAALSGLVRNRNSNNGRGQFTPLRNLDTPPSEV